VTGRGQSSAETGSDHFETSAYDIALLDAGIENFNVMMYTSVLPPESREITMGEAEERHLLHHGAVLETIKAEMDGEQGEFLCTGVGRIWVYRKEGKDERGKLIGGFAAEYEGHSSEEVAAKVLKQDLHGIVKRRYEHDRNINVSAPEIETCSMIVDEDYGVCFTALCFLTYLDHDVIGVPFREDA
jgi:arginine decarboxylase